MTSAAVPPLVNTDALMTIPKCPECGEPWIQRTIDVHANNVERRNWHGDLVGFDPGVMTAALGLSCKAGHRLEVQLREHPGGWEVAGVDRGASQREQNTKAPAHHRLG